MGRDTIVVVDSDKFTGGMLNKMFSGKYNVQVLSDGVTALSYLSRNYENALMIVLRLVMPQLNGTDILKALVQKQMAVGVPIVMLADSVSPEAANECYDLGALLILEKPFAPKIVKRRLDNILELYSGKNILQSVVDKQVKLLSEQNEKLKKYQNKLIATLSDILEFRNLEPNLHVQRIENITKILATNFIELFPISDLNAEEIDTIASASVLHDIGKISVPDNILLKPGRLTTQEFEMVKSHTTKGCEIIERLDLVEENRFAEICRQIVRHHHERYDGSGYPDGLAGDDIPLPAQLVGLADAYDGLVSNSIYKRGYSHEKAFNMILNGECGAFSEPILKSLTKARIQIENMYIRFDEE